MTKRILHPPLEAGGWPVVRDWQALDDLCVGVFDCPHTTPELTDDGPYVVRSQDVRSGVFRLDEAGHVSEATYQERIARAEPAHGDLLYSREGTYFGNAAEVPPGVKVCLGQRMVLIRPKTALVDPRFLRFWLNSPVLSAHILGFRDGSVAERLNMPTIRNIPVPVVPMDEQRRISEVLGSLDDKIELNRQINETLEAMTQAVFRDWFVDFGPVRRKLAGVTDPVEIMGGLTRDPARAIELAQQFPNALGDEELPEGWAYGSLGELVSNVVERCEPGPITEARPYVPIDTITARSLILHDTRAGSEAQSSLVTFRENDILFGAMRPYFHKVALAGFEGTTRTTVFVLRPRASDDLAYALMIINAESTIEFATSHSSGTTIPYAVWRNGMEGMQVTVPPPSLRAEFGALVEPMLIRMKATAAQNRTLSEARDYLLPRLMSGDVRAREMAQEIAA